MDTPNSSSSTTTQTTSIFSQLESGAADALTAAFAGLSTGGPISAVVDAISAVVKDAVSTQTAPIQQAVSRAADAANQAAAAVAAQTQTVSQAVASVSETAAGAAVSALSNVVAPIEGRLGDLETKAAAYANAHPLIGGMLGILGRVFPHETSALKALLPAPTPTPTPQAG